MVRYYLGEAPPLLKVGDRLPREGLLVISPLEEVGTYDQRDTYAALRPYAPDETIGHCMLVYDLDRLGRGAPFTWDR